MKRVGILGLPQSGKTTLFEILMQGAGAHLPAASGRELVGVVRVPDPRLDRLSTLYPQKRAVYAQLQLVESAGAGHGSARAAARGPDLFSAVRNCDCLLLVLRDFDGGSAPDGADPERDRRSLEAELILNDLAIVENRLEKLSHELRVGKKQHEPEHAVLERCKQVLESGAPLRARELEGEEERLIRGFQLLSLKPVLAVYNQDEHSARVPPAPGPGALSIALKGQLEREIVALPPEERAGFRAELGMTEDALSQVIRACYSLLGLISFFTIGTDELRAWTLRRGQKAVDAAAEVHTDLAHGFIRAEVIAWDRLLEAGGRAKAREKGWLKLEGRDYVVADGECLEIRFSK